MHAPEDNNEVHPLPEDPFEIKNRLRVLRRERGLSRKQLANLVQINHPSVTDGDTVDISPAVEGISTVRLIGVDTPETHFGTEPLRPEASDFTTRQLSAQTVSLELDREHVDRYGRLLAYIYLPDGSMLNETLVRRGYAQVATFAPNIRYARAASSTTRASPGSRASGSGAYRRSSNAGSPTGATGSAAAAPYHRIPPPRSNLQPLPPAPLPRQRNNRQPHRLPQQVLKPISTVRISPLGQRHSRSTIRTPQTQTTWMDRPKMV